MADPSPSPEKRPGEIGESAYEPPESLVAPVLTGVKWKATSLVLREGSRLAIGILLARLLTPEEWGVAGMALIVAALLTMLGDLSLPAALVQRTRITEADRSTVFWTSLAIGVVITALGIALSGLVAAFFGEPQVQWLFAVLCIGFLISSLDKVPGALLTRELAFRSLEVRQIVATLAGAIVALTLALAGAGPWAIIGNSLATTTVSAALLWLLTTWRPRLIFSWDSFRSLIGFGATYFGSQLLMYTQLNADKLLVGRYLGASPLGSYSFAYQLMFTPILNIAYPLQTVLFPVFATIQDQTARLNAAWLRSKRLAVAIMAPAFLMMLAVAPDLIPAVFGSKWDDAIPVLQLLCLAGVAYSLGTANGLVMLVTNKVRTLFSLTLLVTVTTTVAAAVGLRWGIVGVAAAYAGAHWVLVVPELWVTTRAASFKFWPAFRATCSPLPFASAATALTVAVRLGLVELDVPRAVRIVVVAGVLLVVYAGLAYAGSIPLRNEARAAVARIRRRRSAEETSNSAPQPES